MAQLALADALPVPGVVWGTYPQRRESGSAAPSVRRGATRLASNARSRHALVATARLRSRAWEALSGEAHAHAIELLRVRLRREGFGVATIADALGCVADCARRVLGLELYDCQLYAAAVMLDGTLAEMATGEGKTYAAAAAAAVAALACVPVHVVTANDYLVGRDAGHLSALYAALGLRVAAIESTTPIDQRRARYAHDIVYVTARELVFDYLRDTLALGAQRDELARRAAALSGAGLAQPVLRGLCMAIVDEADSVLLDEATVPLVLSREVPDPGHRALLWQALEIARELKLGCDFVVRPRSQVVDLTPEGSAGVEQLARPLAGAWRSRRRREELVATALAALHAYRIDRDYLVRDGRVEIVDRVSGRAATGRVWSRGLQGLIELKEGCRVSPDTRSVAQITYQRFFPRYVRLTGLSGTLREARRELSRLYALRVAEVPLRRPCRRTRLPSRIFADSESRWAAIVPRVRSLSEAGRPVLIGTDCVADSEALAAVLAAAQIPHCVLNARQDRTEAGIVARAGAAGAVTVATNMAGRGTDIVLAAGASERGGLHVLSCQRNGARRTDRQLAGRCARQGDPGSVETWIALDAPPGAPPGRSGSSRFVRKLIWNGQILGLSWLTEAVLAVPQRVHEWREARQRRRLLAQDRAWARRCLFAPTQD